MILALLRALACSLTPRRRQRARDDETFAASRAELDQARAEDAAAAAIDQGLDRLFTALGPPDTGCPELARIVADTQPGRNEAARRVCEALWALPAREEDSR